MINYLDHQFDHLKLETNKIMQAKIINKVFSNNQHPTILAGDLNTEAYRETMNILESFWESSYGKR